MGKEIYLSDRDKSILSSLIGKDTQILYTEEYFLVYGEGNIQSKKIYISLKNNEYVCFSLAWQDMEDNLVSLHRFLISPIQVSNRPNNSGCVSFGSISKIKCIEVYSGRVDETEDLFCDQAILLFRDDGRKIMLSAGDSALRNLVLFVNENAIDDFLRENQFLLRWRKCGSDGL